MARAPRPRPRSPPRRWRPALAAAAEDAGLSEEGVRLETSIGPSERVTADPDQLHRILVNLLRNAREAIESAGMSHAGVVTANLEHRGDDSVIRLSDKRPGRSRTRDPGAVQAVRRLRARRRRRARPGHFARAGPGPRWRSSAGPQRSGRDGVRADVAGRTRRLGRRRSCPLRPWRCAGQ